MYEIWTKAYGQVSTHDTLTDGLKQLDDDALDGGGTVTLSFTGGSFRDVDGNRYVLRKVS